jgi:hypothetical protein
MLERPKIEFDGDRRLNGEVYRVALAILTMMPTAMALYLKKF